MTKRLAITLTIGSLLSVCPLNAGTDSIDANGNALPDSSDGKSAVVDNSKNAPVVQSGSATPNDTEFRIGLPGWMAGLTGDFGVRGFVTDLDIPFDTIFDHLDMIASGSFYARYHRWEFSADGLYLRLSDDFSFRGILFDGAHVSLKQAFAEWFVGYRLINCENGFLSLAAGGRYNYMQGNFRLFRGRLAHGRSFSGDIDWVDPVVGASGKIRVWKPVSLWAKGDIGGFGAASDFTWQVQGGLEVQITRWMYSAIGWRYMKLDYTDGGFTNKTEMHGPYIETGISF